MLEVIGLYITTRVLSGSYVDLRLYVRIARVTECWSIYSFASSFCASIASSFFSSTANSTQHVRCLTAETTHSGLLANSRWSWRAANAFETHLSTHLVFALCQCSERTQLLQHTAAWSQEKNQHFCLFMSQLRNPMDDNLKLHSSVNSDAQRWAICSARAMESDDPVRSACKCVQDFWAQAARNVGAVQGLCGTHLQHLSTSLGEASGSALTHFRRR